MYSLSIIIPTFLRHSALKKKLNEIKILEKEDIEFVFILEREDQISFDLIKSLKSEKTKIIYNKGPHYHSFYLGAEAASGKYLNFMGDDDYILSDNFLKVYKFIIDNSNFEWLIGGGIYYNNQLDKIRYIITKIKFFLLKNYNHNILTLINFIMTPSVIVKKKIFFECGGFNKKYQYAQDYYCWLEISKKYKPKIFEIFTSGATFDETTYSGSFSLKRYFEYFIKIKKYQDNFILNIFQFFVTFYIVTHNFIIKTVFKFFRNIFQFFFKKKSNIVELNNHNLKIVHLTRKFDLKGLGGIEEGIIQLTNSNKTKNISNYLFACGDNKREFQYRNLKVKIFKTSFVLFNSHFSLDLVYYLIKKHKFFDYLHIHSPWPTTEMVLFLLKNTKILITYHADILKKSLLRFLYYRFYKSFVNLKNVKLINVSTLKYYNNSFLKQNLLNDEKVFDQGMGVEDLTEIKINFDLISDKITNFYKSRNKILLFFGRDRHYKGIDTIKYLLKKSNYNFLISSTNEDLKFLKGSPNFLFVDQLNFDEKIFVLRNSYLHLFPSSNRSESLGIALIESQMFSLPVVIYNLNSGSSVIIKNEFNGLIANLESKDDYLKKIEQIMNNNDLWFSLSKNSRQNYLDNFSLKKFDSYNNELNKLNV